MAEVSILSNVTNEYEMVSSKVKECYNGEWDDAIHDSFGKYINQVQEISEDLKGIKNKAFAIEEEINKLEINEILKESEKLRSEVGKV